MSGKVTPQVLLNYLQSVDAVKYDQFTIDWIEAKVDDLMGYADGSKENRYDTIRLAMSYDVENVLQIMRPDALVRPFFEKLLTFVDCD